MKHTDHNLGQPRLLAARSGLVAALLLALALIISAHASAAYEQVGIFSGSLTPPAEPGKFPEEVQLGGVSGMAVNVDGAGGIAPGTLYAASEAGEDVRIARFSPKGEFELAWVVSSKGPYERCGPKVSGEPHCTARPIFPRGRVDVDIDQTTGSVYAFSTRTSVGEPTIVAYTPDGSKVITRLAELASSSETAAVHPEKVHGANYPGGIAVNDSGEVYVFDLNSFDNFYHRLMVFKPQTPGDYEHYVYAGQSHDIGAGFLGKTPYPTEPVTDAAGDMYVAGPEAEYIQKYDPAHPASPICEFEFEKSGISAYTVNRDTGEVFYYTYKDKRIHQLEPCNAQGEFPETEPPFKVAPQRDDLYAMAFNPSRQSEPSRVAGVLYAGAPGATPAVGKGEPGQSALGYIFAPVKEVAPEVKSESVSQVTTNSARVDAQIDPKGSTTSYAFQYITDAAYEENGKSFASAIEAPPGGAVIGAGQGALSAAAVLSGLFPDTEYRYRAIATSHCSPTDKEKVCEDVGEAQSFRTFPVEAPGMPDNRAWELASPTLKNGGQVMPADPQSRSCSQECKPGDAYEHFPMQSAPNGEAIVYEGTPFSAEGAVIENEYIAHRDAKTGWQTMRLSPPLASRGSRQGYKAFDPSLTQGLLFQINSALSPEAPLEYANLYGQPTATPTAFSPLLSAQPPNRSPGIGNGSFRLNYVGASADLSRVFFEANDALTEETPFAPEAVDGGETKNNLYEWANGQLSLVNVAPGNAETGAGAVFGSGFLLESSDFNTPSAVFAPSISKDGSRAFWTSEAGQLFARIDDERTLEVPGPGNCTKATPLAERACFLTASADGSKVLLADGQLYELNEEASAYEASTDLTEGNGGFLGIIGHSEDLSHIYFVETAVLTGEEENDHGAKAQAGKPNLYAWDGATTAFIATLVAEDNPDLGDWQASPSVRTAEASPDGRWVTFLSEAPLSGYDNADAKTGKADREVFLYDSAANGGEGRLLCASCNPSGARPLGRATLRTILAAEDSLPQPRYLTDEGRLYFDTQDSLSLFDTNEGVEDVYQYEPEGVGSCKREGGCVSLLSAGHEPVDSNLLAIDETGKNVFFTTRDQLVLKDKDQLFDLYVAREGGGIPGESEVARSECQGEACVPALTPPNDPTPASSAFEGAGNVDEGKAKKKHAKKHRKKRKHAKKSHKRAAKHNRGGVK
ncbi:MAG: hypothetical protein QOF13_2580 [Solirubrobacterales bacterium]|jgi:hypothetical protein|nr:hypothetical protein [Solirubrobacterales bacterium]